MSGRAFLKRLWVLMAIVFVDMLGFLIVLPLLPFYAEEFGASESMVGVLISAFAFAQVLTAPVWGWLSDRLGRRPLILVGLMVSASSYLLFGLANTVFLLLISRLVQGVGTGNIGVVQAYVSDAVSPAGRTQALGWVTVASSAGVMIGPAVGSLSTKLGDAAPGFVAAALCLLNFVFAWVYLPESAEADDAEEDKAREGETRARSSEDVPAGTRPSEEPAPRPAPRQSPGRAILQVLLHPGSTLASLIWIYALGMMAFMAMNGVVALYLERVFHFTKETIGWFYFYVGAVSTLMRGFVLGPVVKRLGEVRTLRIGVLSIATGLAVIPFAQNLISLGAVALLVPVGTALLFPATTSLVSQSSPRGEVGQNLGVQQSFGGVSRMLGPIWAAATFQYIGIRAPFWIASGLMGVVLLIALGVSRAEVGSKGREKATKKVDGEPLLDSEAPTAERL